MAMVAIMFFFSNEPKYIDEEAFPVMNISCKFEKYKSVTIIFFIKRDNDEISLHTAAAAKQN